MATIKDLVSNKTISRELCSQLDVADNHQCVTRLTQHYIELELIRHKDPKYFDKYYNSDGKTGNRFVDVLVRSKSRLTLKAFHDCAFEKERLDICDLLPDIPANQLLRNVHPSVLKDIGEKLTPSPGILVANWEEFAEHFKLNETQINEIKTSRVNTVTNSPAKELLKCLCLESPKTLVSDIVSHFRKYYFNSIADFLQEHLDKGNIRKLPLICESESFACVSHSRFDNKHEVHGNSNSPGQKEEIHSNPQSDYRPNRGNQHATTFQEYLTPQDDIIQNQQKQLKKCNDQVLSSSNEISRNQTENHERSSESEGGMGNCAFQKTQSQQLKKLQNCNVGDNFHINENQQVETDAAENCFPDNLKSLPSIPIQYYWEYKNISASSNTPDEEMHAEEDELESNSSVCVTGTNSDDGRSGDEFSDNEFDEEDSSNSCSQIQDGNSIPSMEITNHQGTPTEKIHPMNLSEKVQRVRHVGSAGDVQASYFKQLLPPSTSPSSFVGASSIAPDDERIAEEDKSIAQNTHDNKNTYESSSDCRPGVKTSDVKDKSSCRHCVIISNTSCLKNGKWKTKSQKMSKATENDLNKLQNLLQSNEFCIIHHSNLSSQAMEKTFQEQSQCNHSAYDGFLGIILTWGEGDVIFGCDNVPFNLTATVKRFGDVESLKGKPIIFIVRSLEKSKMFARDNVQPTTIKKSNDSTLIYHGKCYGSNGYHEDGTSCFVEGLYPMLNIDNLDMRLMHGILSENNFPVVEGKRKGFFKGPLSLFMG